MVYRDTWNRARWQKSRARIERLAAEKLKAEVQKGEQAIRDRASLVKAGLVAPPLNAHASPGVPVDALPDPDRAQMTAVELRALRTAARLPQDVLAAALTSPRRLITSAMVAKWERGTHAIPLDIGELIRFIARERVQTRADSAAQLAAMAASGQRLTRRERYFIITNNK